MRPDLFPIAEAFAERWVNRQPGRFLGDDDSELQAKIIALSPADEKVVLDHAALVESLSRISRPAGSGEF